MLQRTAKFDIFTILEAIQDGIYLTDREGKTLFVNRSYERITGLSRAELIGQNVIELQKQGYFSEITNPQVVKTGRTTTFMQTNKANRQLVVSGYPIYDASQRKVLGVITVVRDIPLLEQLGQEIEYQRALIEKYRKDAGETLEKESKTLVFSNKMQKVVDLATRLSGVDTTVLITGETGVGKEIIARMLHSAGPRKNQPFLTINCAAIPEALIESELFGYEAGAFTGAHTKGKPGVFELADKGTLFLDEIGEMPLTMQAKLLRSMQAKEIMRVGGKSVIRISTRIVAASNRSLEDLVQKGQFREDLYYRLSVVKIEIPPLRERREAIEPLASHFLTRFNTKHRRQAFLSPAALDALRSYDWPGNIRQLENMMESLVIACPHDEINLCDLPAALARNNFETISAQNVSNMASCVQQSLRGMMDEMEKRVLSHYLTLYNNDIYRLAEELQRDRSTLQRKLRKYGIPISRKKSVAAKD